MTAVAVPDATSWPLTMLTLWIVGMRLMLLRGLGFAAASGGAVAATKANIVRSVVMICRAVREMFVNEVSLSPFITYPFGC
jgi:hypothetical protein